MLAAKTRTNGRFNRNERLASAGATAASLHASAGPLADQGDEAQQLGAAASTHRVSAASEDLSVPAGCAGSGRPDPAEGGGQGGGGGGGDLVGGGDGASEAPACACAASASLSVVDAEPVVAQEAWVELVCCGDAPQLGLLAEGRLLGALSLVSGVAASALSSAVSRYTCRARLHVVWS